MSYVVSQVHMSESGMFQAQFTDGATLVVFPGADRRRVDIVRVDVGREETKVWLEGNEVHLYSDRRMAPKQVSDYLHAAERALAEQKNLMPLPVTAERAYELLQASIPIRARLDAGNVNVVEVRPRH